MTQLTLEIKHLSPNATLPTKPHADDSGFDIYASEDAIVEPGETVVVKTDIAVKLPPGHEATVRPRSGVTSRTKLRVQIGTIDNGYNGEIGVIVGNIAQSYVPTVPYFPIDLRDNFATEYLDQYPFNTYLIRKGDRIAQLVVTPVALPQIVEVDELGETDRGDDGFGASGVR